MASQAAFIDHHERQYLACLPEGMQYKSHYTIPLTGAQLSKMPRYRLLEPVNGIVPTSLAELRAEADMWKAAFAKDYRECIAAGQMHVHKSTCFKYVSGNGVKS